MELNDSADVVAREEQGIAIPLRDQHRKPALAPDGTPIMLTVVGSYSDRYRAALESYQAWVREAAAELEEGEEIDPKLRDKKWVELVLAKAVIGWTPGLTRNGQPFDYSEENAVILLTGRPWISDDVQQAVVRHERFFDEPSITSRAA